MAIGNLLKIQFNKSHIMEEQNNPIIIYQSEDGNTRIEVKLENETVWLTQQQLCDLYQTGK